jgi:RNA-directed DNA polymerase
MPSARAGQSGAPTKPKRLSTHPANDIVPFGRAQLAGNLHGWKACFPLAQTSKVFREFDAWIRHQLRAVSRKHWRRGTGQYLALKALSASGGDARKLAANGPSWWRNDRYLLNRERRVACFERLNAPSAIPLTG